MRGRMARAIDISNTSLQMISVRALVYIYCRACFLRQELNWIHRCHIPQKQISLHHVTDASLCLSTGILRCRLNPIIYHIPYEAGGRSRCRLHWWDGVETQKKILACPGCGVSFCVKCYRLFHKEADILGMKSKLMKEFKKGK